MESKMIQCINSIMTEDFFPFLEECQIELEPIINAWELFLSGTNTKTTKKTKKSEPIEKENITYTREDLEKMFIKQLKPICLKLKLTTSGLKAELINRISKKMNIDQEESKQEESTPNKLDLESFRKPDILIQKNEYGHWIHNETGIVFTEDEENINGFKCRLAIGYQDEDNEVIDLDKEKLELCNQYGFRARDQINIII